jgi:N-methylhydantoinase A
LPEGKRPKATDVSPWCGVYERERLQCGNRLADPAIIEQVDATIVMQPGHGARVDSYGNVIVEVMGERK